jgi:glycosyltransferase involved in cell wall biosynthesis
MKILFVSNSFPNNLSTSSTPSIGGTERRLDMLVESLKHIAQLDMLFYVSPDMDISVAATAQIAAELSRYWNTQINLTLCPKFSLPLWRQFLEGIVDFSAQRGFYNTRGSEQIRIFQECLERQPDVIFIQRLQSVYPALSLLKNLPPVFFDLDDVEHIKLIRQLRQPGTSLKALLYYLHVPALWWGERRAMRLAHRTFVCSEHDRHYLADVWRSPRVVPIPNARLIPPAQPIASQPTLLLVGSYFYPPNICAANFLIEEVLPLICSKIPEVRLIVAGVHPENIRSFATQPANVEFTGFVEDLDSLYQQSRVVCCPIFSGSGTRIKMIEAAAYGKPIISTQIGAEGLNLLPGKDYRLANTAVEFAAACLDLLRDDAACNELGNAARAAAIQHYDLQNVAKLIQTQVYSAVRTQIATSASPIAE